ncbi:MAG: hypothetical protein WCK63_17985 [Betaproteobacteria bacterium]
MTFDLLPRLMALQARNNILEHLVFLDRVALGLVISDPERGALVAREAIARIDRWNEGRA